MDYRVGALMFGVDLLPLLPVLGNGEGRCLLFPIYDGGFAVFEEIAVAYLLKMLSILDYSFLEEESEHIQICLLPKAARFG